MSYGLSALLIHPMLSYMVQKGYDIDSFCRMASCDRSILQDAEMRIAEEEFDRLQDAAADFTKDEHLGLHLGQSIELSSLGILGYVLLHCPTIGDALAAYRRYNVIVCSGIDIELDTEQEETTIRFKVSDPSRQASRHAIEGMVSSLYHILLKLSCRSIVLSRLQFMHHAPEDQREYTAMFGVNPAFESGMTLIRLANEVMQYPIVLSNEGLLNTFEQYAEEARNELLHGRTLADQVYKWITECMPAVFPSVTEAAQHFHLSVRSLQTNLKQEHTTYNQLFNKARMAFAIQYLKNPRFTVGEIAYLLQFSEPSAFQSAFKRWTGLPPGQYRRRTND